MIFYFVVIVLLAWPTVTQCNNRKMQAYKTALEKLDWDAVKKDIKTMLTQSKDFWPADYGNYGPLMIRLAWHCSGSYRTYDGHGGCDGGRQRFDPERSWMDNTNLDKARTLLWPVKQKHGLGLSWGDLIVLTGTVAIESMGGPVLGFCGGRIDDYDGSESVLLGPTPEQNATYPCLVNGQCKPPLGTTTIGLIYLNPEGPMGYPLPASSAPEVRDAFSRMSMNDLETVALIGGGHAFGKCHGACPLGPGPSPKENPSNPWPGLCGTGKGKDTFTSGFEGPWSTSPTQWSNNYFTELIGNTWDVIVGPGGHHQWRTRSGPQNILMLTTDVSLLNDPMNIYQKYLQMFASNITALEYYFSRAWYKLVSRDMGPVTRCVGPWVPPVQDFQNPLPPTPANLPDFYDVISLIDKVLFSDQSEIIPPDVSDGKSYYNGLFVHLAWQCSSTFRHTDYLGGCNGARIRFPPQSTWSANVGMDRVIKLLQPVKDSFENLSWADLIVLAGTVAISEVSNTSEPFTFCGGRTDAMDGEGSSILQPNGGVDYNAYYSMRDQLGLTDVEAVALMGRPRSATQMVRMGYNGTWSPHPLMFNNQYFITLLNEEWMPYTVSGSGNKQYKAVGKDLYILPADISLRWDANTLAIAQDFASDNSYFLVEFISAWTKVMNIDRFAGPVDNLCNIQKRLTVL